MGLQTQQHYIKNLSIKTYVCLYLTCVDTLLPSKATIWLLLLADEKMQMLFFTVSTTKYAATDIKIKICNFNVSPLDADSISLCNTALTQFSQDLTMGEKLYWRISRAFTRYQVGCTTPEIPMNIMETKTPRLSFSKLKKAMQWDAFNCSVI